MEANLADVRRGGVDVRIELPARAKRVDGHLPARREDELAQVDVPVPLARPADVRARGNDLSRQDDGVDVPVAEVADMCEAARAVRRREVHGPTLDGEDTMRSAIRRAGLRAVVAHRDVDAVVIDRAELGIGSRIEERPANRVLLVERPHGPASPRVVVHLGEVELPGNPLRHCDGLSQREDRLRRRREPTCGLASSGCLGASTQTVLRVCFAR